MEILTWAGFVLATLAVLYACLAAFGAWRWSLSGRRLVSRLDATAIPPVPAYYRVADLASLPEPVRRYLGRALTDGQPIIRSTRLSMRGTFNTSLSSQSWKDFAAIQHVITCRPGFVWDARIRMFPGLPVRVTDSYIGGRGELHPALLGLLPLGEQDGDGEIARAELMRWFAEAVWYPTAFLPSQSVNWTPINAASAHATMTDGPLVLTLLFRFGADGMVASVHADARAATLDGVSVMLPWECRLSDYQHHDGMMVPMTGEVLYLTAEGERPYFRGKITRISHSPST